MSEEEEEEEDDATTLQLEGRESSDEASKSEHVDPGPTCNVEEPEPTCDVEEPEPSCNVEEPEPTCNVEEAEPIYVEEPEPINVEKPEPINVEEPEPTHVEEPEPTHVEEPEPRSSLPQHAVAVEASTSVPEVSKKANQSRLPATPQTSVPPPLNETLAGQQSYESLGSLGSLCGQLQSCGIAAAEAGRFQFLFLFCFWDLL